MVQIPRLILDPRNDEELLEGMFIRAINASNGTLTDSRVSSPLAAIFEGAGYAIQELMWYANLLPEAVALEVMRYSTGLERLDATFAQGTFVFSLLEVRGQDFIIDTSFRVSYLDAFYSPIEPIIIPAGFYEVEGIMRCSVAGTKYNVSEALGVNETSPALSGLSRVYNVAPITNARDLEPLETTFDRMQQHIRSKGTLVSPSDYEVALSTLAGVGSRVKVVPLMDSNKVAGVTGNVHCFLLYANGEAPTLAECGAFRDTLGQSIFAGSLVWVSPFIIQELTLKLVIEVGVPTKQLSDLIGAAVEDYLNPLSYNSQRVRVQDIEFIIRSTSEDVLGIDTVLIEDSGLDYTLPTLWTLPRLLSAEITLTNGLSTTTYLYGLIQELA